MFATSTLRLSVWCAYFRVAQSEAQFEYGPTSPAEARAECNVEEFHRLRGRVLELEQQNALLEQTLAARASKTGIVEDSRGVFGVLQVAHVPFAQNFAHLPENPSGFWLEVGSNSRDLLVDDMGDAFSRGIVLLSFEPLLDKYAALLTRYGGGRADQRQGLSRQHERAMVFPFAVGCTGSARFYVTPVDGCSSLLQPRGSEFAEDAGADRWSKWVGERCVHTADERWVPCITLEHVISKWLDGRDIEYAKLDAQGADLAVVQSAGQLIDRLKVVTMEATCDHAAKLYKDALNCTSVYSQMRRIGFQAFHDKCDKLVSWEGKPLQWRCKMSKFQLAFCRHCEDEIDITFARPGARIPAHLTSERRYRYRSNQ